ncbi:DMT family transporter [Cognatiyoonia sp. IB215182]|uniref:DMT family transporter n=1 Tax=Cognatiyoonia sp. IB215182 TaxID=3097353 RepID=UPI002A14B522|nr:DMT family transporter [Cognatiyoonia sp. IB215182]MDX8350825.1 DMT family transporter [Cognatiyoonia sp. IB215182]
MQSARITHVATVLAVSCGLLWGLYWLPVRALADAGLEGAWGTFLITASAMIVLLPFAVRYRYDFRTSSPLTLAAIALGGAAFALYSIGFVYGRVAIIVLLFFLTPVWSTLIGRYILGWQTPPLRLAAIAVGLVGLALMLSADGHWPIPRNIGEWMGLTSGILWSISSTAMRARASLKPGAAAFVFACGAAFASLVIAVAMATPPAFADAGRIAVIAFGTGTLWWGLTIIALIWATMRLDPARTGILLMSEVLVGATSAAIIAQETLSPLEIIGGLFVLAAAILELWPTKQGQTASGRA